MRARIAVATVVLVVSAGRSAAGDGVESIRLPVPKGNVTAFTVPGLEPWIFVRTQGTPQPAAQPKGGPPAGKAASRVLLREELDRRIARSVYATILTGTSLWEEGNYEGTFWLYYGTLVGVMPLLDHYPKLAAQVDDAVRRTAKMRPTDGAFVLREALDAIQKETSVALTPKELWDRLGGEKGVRAVVKDFLANTARDKEINLTRGTFKPEGKDLERLEQALVEAISEQTGGPLKSAAGMGLKDVLAGTKLTQVEYIGIGTNFRLALVKNRIPNAESKELIDVLSKLENQIVGQ